MWSNALTEKIQISPDLSMCRDMYCRPTRVWLAVVPVEIKMRSKEGSRLCVCGRGFLACHCQARDIIIFIGVFNDISRGTLSNYRAK